MRRFLYVIAFLSLLGGLFTTTVLAQSGTPSDDEVNAIARKLYCPVCESTPLDVCPTQACKEWRELIRSMLAEGKTEDEILQHFVDQYGARVLAEPPKEGFFWLIYLLPPAVILIGVVVLFRSLKEWTKPKAVSPVQSAAQNESSAKKDDYVARLEEELKKQK
ncbi:Cytochrome c-type biogenesis protein CcmH [Anaerolineales bacterium]|nr:Cytochrome c-type biogenesis protein CcmH [Anaerolineales bacterium]